MRLSIPTVGSGGYSTDVRSKAYIMQAKYINVIGRDIMQRVVV
jgi:hypothetical protein